MCDDAGDDKIDEQNKADPSPEREQDRERLESIFSEGFKHKTRDSMFHLEQRMAERNAAIIASERDFISDSAYLCWAGKGDLEGLRFFLVETRLRKELEEMRKIPALKDAVRLLEELGHYNGYVRFPKLPMVAPGCFNGIQTYVAVHGGMTFFQEWWDGSVTYGFDTSHAWSAGIGEIINDIGWLMAETEAMARGIQIAARFEPYYLNARTEQRKAAVLDRMQRFMPVNAMENFGVMVNILTGEL